MTAATLHREEEQEPEAAAVRLLRKHAVKAVVFDMDLTAVRMHSRGRLLRRPRERRRRRSCDGDDDGGDAGDAGSPANEALDAYCRAASEDFVRLVPVLYERGFFLSIATHSDEAEFEFDDSIGPETHILGSELATALLRYHFPDEITSSFFVVAYNPSARAKKLTGNEEEENERSLYKRHHMRRIRNRFQIDDPKEILFFDDTPQVVADCRQVCGVRAVLVDAQRGFRMSDLLQNDFSSRTNTNESTNNNNTS